MAAQIQARWHESSCSGARLSRELDGCHPSFYRREGTDRVSEGCKDCTQIASVVQVIPSPFDEGHVLLLVAREQNSLSLSSSHKDLRSITSTPLWCLLDFLGAASASGTETIGILRHQVLEGLVRWAIHIYAFQHRTTARLRATCPTFKRFGTVSYILPFRMAGIY